MLSKKNYAKLAISVVGIAGLKTLELKTGVYIPLILYATPPLGSHVLIKELHTNLYYQTKRNPIISGFKHIKENYKNILLTKRYVLHSVLLSTSIYLYENYINNLKFGGAEFLPSIPIYIYPSVLILSYAITLGQKIKNNWDIMNTAQYIADETIKGLNIIDMRENETVVLSAFVLKKEHTKQLEHIVNHDISMIKQDEYIKLKYHLIEGKTDYRHLEVGSYARLERILTNMRDNPVKISEVLTDNNDIYTITTTLPYKRLLRSLEDITHKLGLNKGKLTIGTNSGYVIFQVAKEVVPTYLLDTEIVKAKPKDKAQLPFILGINIKNDSIMIKDLVEMKHLLIAGKTGSGKSCTFKGIIESLMYFNPNTVWFMLDFADSALMRYAKFYNVNYIEPEVEPIKKALSYLLEEYTRRKKLLADAEVENIKEYNQEHKEKIPFLIFAIDEANAFKSEIDKKEFEANMEKPIKTLLQRGRKYGMFLIMAVQQTNDTDFVKSWKTQFTRIAHLLEDSADCQNVTTKKEFQQLIPGLGLGEFYLLSDNEELKIKACLTDKEHNKLYETLRKGRVLNANKKNTSEANSQDDNIIEIQEKAD